MERTNRRTDGRTDEGTKISSIVCQVPVTVKTVERGKDITVVDSNTDVILVAKSITDDKGKSISPPYD